MTVAELIEELRRFPQEFPVVIEGYEGGADDVNQLSIERLRLGTCDGEGMKYSGDHDLIDDYEEDYKTGISCVLLWHKCVVQNA